MKKKIEEVNRTIKHHGFKNVFYQSAIKTISKFLFFNVLTCVVISKPKESSLEIDSKFNHGFLENDKILNLSKNIENELPPHFLKSAFEKGDKCYALTDEEELAGYGWYSNRETMTDIEKLKFYFNPKYIYMYKGLTKKSYRGQRLHAVGMSLALNSYREKGYEGIISYVDSTNLDSLKSCFRMGYQKVGSVYIVKILGKVYSYPTKSCRSLDIRLEA